MANKQALQVEEQFEVVKALYEEAKLTLPAEERAQLVEIQPVDPIASPITSPTGNITGNITGNDGDSLAEQPVIIRSRKPRISANAEPIFTRISDLYEEAEAAKLLAEETDLAASDSDDAHEISLDNAAENSGENAGEHEATPAAASDSQSLSDSDFAIPAEFGASDSESASESESESESDVAAALESDKEPDSGLDIETSEPALSEEELALLTQTIHADETFDATDVSISDDIEPAVALDDVLDGLLPPDAQDDQNAQEPQLASSAEAQALSELDANRPQADDALKEQLADVKQAVEQAAATGAEPAQADTSDETEDEGNHDLQDELQKDMASLTPGPELARFIGETVRDVLDEELPQLVRGLVDETLGERQGRYGRVDTPHIGLRTKPSRH